ncbi:MAG: ABC transporter permease [Bacteroides sp.]|nr:ABC transporter permease [Prevotella sp.]MCM1407629.1 ABC transporter permease [Treponema brennaborense]MCM1469221.1 ABC transporter permease [Bacteroides sp.]
MIFGISAGKIYLAVFQTIYMVGVSLIFGLILAFPLAVVLFATRKGGIKQNVVVHAVFSTVINIVRSVPFIILIVYIMPLTKMIVGTRVGSKAALVPLVCYITPFLARLIENAFFEVDSGIIEAAQAMGATMMQTIFKFVLPEAKGGIILGITTGTVSLLGATAMAGAVGGGGVGDLALTYGYQRFNQPLMTSTVVILIVFVQIIQTVGTKCANKVK